MTAMLYTMCDLIPRCAVAPSSSAATTAVTTNAAAYDPTAKPTAATIEYGEHIKQ